MLGRVELFVSDVGCIRRSDPAIACPNGGETAGNKGCVVNGSRAVPSV